MDEGLLKALAVLGALTWLAAGVLAFRRPRAAAVLNAVLALFQLLAATPSLLRWLRDPEGYVQQYGTAALADLPSAGGIVALSVIALVAVSLAFVRYPQAVWVAWGANLPFVGALIYLSFWFRIF